MRKCGKEELFETVKSLVPIFVAIIYTHQCGSFGLDHAIWCARDIVDDESLCYSLGRRSYKKRRTCRNSAGERVLSTLRFSGCNY